MRSNDRYRAIWRRVDGPVPASDLDLDQLASRISLRARARSPRAAIYVGLVAAAMAVLAVSAMPRQRPPTLLEAVSGGEKPARTFEVALVGPSDGAWLIAAAVGQDQ